MHETSLHRELKFTYAGTGGQTEAGVGSYVADGINAAGEYFEVQTGSFGPLRKKAIELAAKGRLRIIYPVILVKYLEVFDIHGNLLYRKKSPKKGSPWDIFNALIHAPDLPNVNGIIIELALVDAVERRVRDGKGSWRRRGISIVDRRIETLHECICLEKPADYLRFLPFNKNEKITSCLLKEKTGIPITAARKTLYVLVKLGLIEMTGKQGHYHVYRITSRRKISQKP